MTTKERYVSYEIAKLLKEKGFAWRVFNFYDEHEGFSEHIGSVYSLYNWNYPTKDEYGSQYCSAPTQQMACDWLTEEKGLYISVVPDFNEYGEYPDDLYWFARVYDLKNGDYIHSTKLCVGSQEAFETALEYCLKNIV